MGCAWRQTIQIVIAFVILVSYPTAVRAADAERLDTVRVKYSSGDTKLETWNQGIQLLTNRDGTPTQFPDALKGLTFTRRPYRHKCKVSLDIPEGATVYLIMGTGSLAAESRKACVAEGWTRLGPVAMTGKFHFDVYTQDFSKPKKVTMVSSGDCGIIVATGSLELAPPDGKQGASGADDGEQASAPALPVVGDPAVWAPPTELPQLQEIVKGDKYRKRFDAALKSLPADEDINAPVTGQMILSILPDSQAEKLGLKVGDVLVSIDGHPIRGSLDIQAARLNAGGDLPVKVWSDSDYQYKTVTLKPGLVGITTRLRLRRDLEYTQSIPAGGAADNNLLVASLSIDNDPDLAETALWHAQQEDNKSPMLPLLASALRCRQMRYEDAMALGDIALKSLPSELQWTAATCTREAAVASFHWKYAVDLDGKYGFLATNEPWQFSDELSPRYTEYSQMPVDQMANPIEEFNKLAYTDLSRKVTDAGVMGHTPESILKQFNETGSLDFSDTGADPKQYWGLMMGPPGANVDFSATVHFKGTAADFPAEKQTVRFEIMSQNWSMVSLCINRDGACFVNGDLPILPVVRSDLKSEIQNDQKFKFHMAVVGNRFEVVVNDHRLYYGPVIEAESTRKLTTYLEMKGTTGAISNYCWQTAEPRVK